MSNGKDVIVIKCRRAGLSTITRLQAAGIPVEILDAIDRPDPPADKVVLYPYQTEILMEPPAISENPHRAKKLKGRNRRKW